VVSDRGQRRDLDRSSDAFLSLGKVHCHSRTSGPDCHRVTATVWQPPPARRYSAASDTGPAIRSKAVVKSGLIESGVTSVWSDGSPSDIKKGDPPGSPSLGWWCWVP